MLIKTLIVHHYIAHYRIPVFKELTQLEGHQYEFLSGKELVINIKTIDQKTADYLNIAWRVLRNHWLGNDVLWQSGLLKICAKDDYDCLIVMANPYFLSSWLAILVAKLRRKKVLMWGHFTLRDDFKSPAKKMFYRLADRLLPYGEWAKKKLVQEGFNPEKIFVVHNSLDYEKQVKIRDSISLPSLTRKKARLFSRPELPILVFIGRFTPQKKLDLLIKAARRLHDDKIPVNLILIGSGNIRPELEALVQENALGQYCVFTGAIYDEAELAPYLMMADLCVSPGNVGLTAMHAMAYGTPVITHNNPLTQGPEFEAVVEGKTGAFFEENSLESLTSAIRSWLESSSGNRDKIRSACHTRIEAHYTPSAMAEVFKMQSNPCLMQVPGRNDHG